MPEPDAFIEYPLCWSIVDETHPVSDEWNALGRELAKIPKQPTWECATCILIVIRSSKVFKYFARIGGFDVQSDGRIILPLTDVAADRFARLWNLHAITLRSELRRSGLSAKERERFLHVLKMASDENQPQNVRTCNLNEGSRQAIWASLAAGLPARTKQKLGLE